MQGLVGDVPGATADYSEHFWFECLEDLGVGWRAASPLLYPVCPDGSQYPYRIECSVAKGRVTPLAA